MKLDFCYDYIGKGYFSGKIYWHGSSISFSIHLKRARAKLTTIYSNKQNLLLWLGKGYFALVMMPYVSIHLKRARAKLTKINKISCYDKVKAILHR